MQFANFAERIKGMILYFSATGNSHYVAQKIAEATGDKIISIETLVKEKRFELSTNEDEALGIVTPTYFWGLPHIVEEVLAHLNIRLASGCYVYLVATYGTTTGAIGKISRCILSRKLIRLQGEYCVRMPDTWTPMFNLSDKAKNERRLIKAQAELEIIINNIRHRVAETKMRGKAPLLLGKLYHATYKKARNTHHFHVIDDRCVGCGLCQRQCPISAIALQNGKPKWVAELCLACLRCLHNCPAFAIQYGRNSLKHGQYVCPLR